MRTKRFYKEPLSYASPSLCVQQLYFLLTRLPAFSSALLTGVVQACRAQPAALPAGAAALNSGISAATFFGAYLLIIHHLLC
jgi:hypothetical protein